MTPHSRDPQSGRCWSCGYLLKGIESPNCPECGRPFDRADPATMNFGRPMGRLTRWFVGPLGKGTTLLSVLGAILVLATTRPAVKGWQFTPTDLAYYARAWEWKSRAPLTWTDAAYTAGLALTTLALLWWLIRIIARAIVIIGWRVPRFQRGRILRPTLLLFLFSTLTTIGVFTGWSYRLGQRWVAEFKLSSEGQPRPQSPVPLTVEAKRSLLRSALSQGWTPKQRLWAVKVVCELNYESELLAEAIETERDSDEKAWEIRLCGFSRNVAQGQLLKKLLDDPDPKIRAAAADALGALHQPFDEYGTADQEQWTDSDPPIQRPPVWERVYKPLEVPVGSRDALVHQMTTGPTVAEREAAARALVNWPAPVRLHTFRYAEWGVFQIDVTGRRKLIEAQLAEVPAFVHRVGDPAGPLFKRFKDDDVITAVSKPVIHLTSDIPLSADIEILIQNGRPLVAYPKPDDFTVGANIPSPVYEKVIKSLQSGYHDKKPPIGLSFLDPLNLPHFEDAREGYPFMTPHHREIHFPEEVTKEIMGPLYNFLYRGPTATTQPSTRPTTDYFTSIGLRWQSVIVSPTKLPWMKDQATGDDPRFAWWNRLRKVDCSYVSSRGESDKFLYYDGPSLNTAPIRARLAGGRLIWEDSRLEPQDPDEGPPGLPMALPSYPRDSIYFECSTAGVAQAIPLKKLEKHERFRQEIELGSAPRIDSSAAEKWLEESLIYHNLTQSETAGLIDTWRTAMFKTPGRRFLTIASGGDYDSICPMKIRPTPTQTARVAIFWTELDH